MHVKYFYDLCYEGDAPSMEMSCIFVIKWKRRAPTRPEMILHMENSWNFVISEKNPEKWCFTGKKWMGLVHLTFSV